MAIPTFLDVWSDQSGFEVEVRYRWPRPPETRGQARLRDLVNSSAHGLGPYEPGVTFPRAQADLEQLLTDAGLSKTALVIERSLAAEFLSAAVSESEISAQHELKARDTGPPDPANAVDFFLFWSELDRARRASRKAVMLAAASLEAHINFLAFTELSVWKEEDRLSLLDKWMIVPRVLCGKTFDRGSQPFQGFHELVALRHKLMHPKTRRERLDYPEVGHGMAAAMFTPSDDADFRSGRQACIVARAMYLEFSRITATECPDWVSVVPPGDSAEAKNWMGASIRDGIRHDPDFPWRHDHPDALPFPWAGVAGSPIADDMEQGGTAE